MRPRSIVMLFAALAGLGMSGGCRAPASSSANADYQTVGKDPRRDTDAAKLANAKAVEMINGSKYDEAEGQLRQALSADVTFGPAHNNLGRVYFHQKKLYLAAWEFQYAVKLMPDQPEPRNNLGLVFEQVGKLDDAVNSYDEARKMRPDDMQFLGNATRARVRRGDKNTEVHELLEKVVMRDERESWVQWAKERLALMPRQPASESRPATLPSH